MFKCEDSPLSSVSKIGIYLANMVPARKLIIEAKMWRIKESTIKKSSSHIPT
jgi:hypothetical protein